MNHSPYQPPSSLSFEESTLKVMDKKEVLNLNLSITEEKCESLYPVYFGVSCAFFALQLLSVSGKDENCEKLVQGSAQLLGLLIWMNKQKSDLLHKIEIAEREIETLKRTRREDAKANEKVVRIFATQEQSWFVERKKLRQHLGGLMKEMRIFEKKKEEEAFEMSDRLKEMEFLMESMEKNVEEETEKRKELEEKLSNAENVAEELREKAKGEAREHSSGLWKLKTAFIELVSNQRRLEAETRRSAKQVEATKQELNSVLLQKEESVLLVQKLSAQVVRMSNDLEHKDKILSAMLRKSKLDRAEKQMLLNDVKLSKAKRKQAELEMERWKSASELRHERQSLRSAVSSQLNPRSDVSSSGKAGLMAIDHVIESNYLEFMREFDFYCPLSDGFNSQGNEIADLQQLNVSVQTQAEEGLMLLQRRHNEEIDAFAEQMRVKDEKLEAFRWQLLSMELEMKRLHSHAAGLNQDVLQLKRDNMKLEALSVAREEELASLKMELIQSVEAEALEPERSAKMAEEEDVASDKNSSINHFHYSSKELEERKDVACQSPSQIAVKIESPKLQSNKYRVDLHALGVSFKIKRLKQQLVMLERMAGRRENEGFNNEQAGTKDFVLLNKQVGRYESLQGKADDLCRRMHESDEAISGDSVTARKKTLLEETLQLQRNVVASGQKLVEIKSRICCAFSGIDDQLVESSGHDVKRFSDNVKTQYEEVQRGVEVRIARMIGDLEGPLAREGMIRLQR